MKLFKRGPGNRAAGNGGSGGERSGADDGAWPAIREEDPIDREVFEIQRALIRHKCVRCGQSLGIFRAWNPDPLFPASSQQNRTAYEGVLCRGCARLECHGCRGGQSALTACSWCGSTVDTAVRCDMERRQNDATFWVDLKRQLRRS